MAGKRAVTADQQPLRQLLDEVHGEQAQRVGGGPLGRVTRIGGGRDAADQRGEQRDPDRRDRDRHEHRRDELEVAVTVCGRLVRAGGREHVAGSVHGERAGVPRATPAAHS